MKNIIPKLIAAVVFFASLSAAAQDHKPCGPETRDWYNKIVEVYEANGYTWPGSFGTCRIMESYGYISWWSGQATSQAVVVTMRINPHRMQFSLGATRSLFCAQRINNVWKNMGKTCEQ